MSIEKEQILQKLSKKFQHAPVSEEDTVYILSRIRIILEMENYPEEYKFLKFYCDFGLHPKITRVPKAVFDKLQGIQKDDDLSADYSMLFHKDFHKELKDFLINHSLPNFYNKNFRQNDFNRLLNAVCSDSKIIIENDVGSKYQITYHKDGSMESIPCRFD